MTATVGWDTQTSVSWSDELGISATLGVEVKVEAGVPMVAKGETTWSASITGSYSHTWGQSVTTSEPRSVSATLNFGPDENSGAISAVISRGTVTLKYKADMHITWSDGSRWKVTDVEGWYKGVHVLKAVTEISDGVAETADGAK